MILHEINALGTMTSTMRSRPYEMSVLGAMTSALTVGFGNGRRVTGCDGQVARLDGRVSSRCTAAGAVASRSSRSELEAEVF